MIEETLLNYGMAGVFIAYLIYDKKVLSAEIVDSLRANTRAIERLCHSKPA